MDSYNDSTESPGALLNIEGSVNMEISQSYSADPEFYNGAGPNDSSDANTTRARIARIFSDYCPSADETIIELIVDEAMCRLDRTTNDHQIRQQSIATTNADSWQDPNRPLYFNVFGSVPQNIANFLNAQGTTNIANFMDILPKDALAPDSETVQSEGDAEHNDSS